MGASLSAANLSTIVEKKAAHGFHVGLAEMNGWRTKMEDAHVIHTCADWAFFGVFDGHGGDQCSAFVAKEFYERLGRDGCPKDNATVKALVLDIDEKYLATEEPSGTTAAMCIVHRPTQPGGKIRLRVANAGDSRVLLGKRDGTIVDGGAHCTDQGLSTDHKPDHPSERERIYRCGGHVEKAQGGVSRVNGDLAVSRGFGDAEFKKTGGPGPEDRPVTADPELEEFECDESDVLIIVCDGVSEGDFSNPQVVKLISESLAKDGDPGAAARATIEHAERMNSKDNITCMVVLFDGKKEECREEKAFTPGPIPAAAFERGAGNSFINSYETMAKRAGLKVEEALEMRCDSITAELASEDLCSDRREELQTQLKVFGDSLPEKGSDADARRSWFKSWADKKCAEPGEGVGGGGGMGSIEHVLRMLSERGGLSGGLGLPQGLSRSEDEDEGTGSSTAPGSAGYESDPASPAP